MMTNTRNPIDLLAQGEISARQIEEFLRSFVSSDLIKSAIFYNRPKTLEILISRHFSRKVLDEDSNTALHLVMRDSSPELVRNILRYTDFHNEPNRDNQTPFEIAILNGKIENVKTLYTTQLDFCFPGKSLCFSDFKRMSLLHLAARQGNSELIQFFLHPDQRPAWDVNLQATNTGWTPLHLAAYNGHIDAIKILIDRGASLELRDWENKNVLDFALTNTTQPLSDRFNVAEMLVAKGIDFTSWQDGAFFKTNVLSRFGIEAADLSHYEYIMMCQIASSGHSEFRERLNQQDKDKFAANERYLRGAGWIKLATSEALNDNESRRIINYYSYYGVAYYKISCINNQNKVELLIAHRGTCFNKLNNVLADYQILLKQQPEILSATKEYYDYIIRSFLTRNWHPTQLTVTHVGFSLGGGIAAAMAVENRQHGERAVTFDAPGMDYLLETHQLSPEQRVMVSERITNYVMPEPTVINTANKHIGEIRQIILGQLQTPTESFYCDYIEIGNESSLSHLLSALRSHNLERINKYGLMYRKLNAWIQADNQVHFGNRPLLTDGRMGFKWNNVFLALLDIVVMGMQLTARGLREAAWTLTKKETESGEEVGMLAIVHARVNTILPTAVSRYESKPDLKSILVDLKDHIEKLKVAERRTIFEYGQRSAEIKTAINSCEFRAKDAIRRLTIWKTKELSILDEKIRQKENEKSALMEEFNRADVWRQSTLIGEIRQKECEIYALGRKYINIEENNCNYNQEFSAFEREIRQHRGEKRALKLELKNQEEKYPRDLARYDEHLKSARKLRYALENTQRLEHGEVKDQQEQKSAVVHTASSTTHASTLERFAPIASRTPLPTINVSHNSATFFSSSHSSCTTTTTMTTATVSTTTSTVFSSFAVDTHYDFLKTKYQNNPTDNNGLNELYINLKDHLKKQGNLPLQDLNRLMAAEKLLQERGVIQENSNSRKRSAPSQ